MKSFTFLIVLSAVLFSACSKAVNAPDAIVNPVSPAGSDAAEPAIASSANGEIFVAYAVHTSKDAADVFVRPFMADGQPTGEAVRVNPSIGSAKTWYGDPPTVKIGTDGTIYVGWTAAVAGGNDLYLSVSHDQGKTFDPPVKVNDDTLPAAHGMHSLAIAANGRVYVAWLDERNVKHEEKPVLASNETQSDMASGYHYEMAHQTDGANQPEQLHKQHQMDSEPNSEVFFAVSTDGGKTFSANKRLLRRSARAVKLRLPPRPTAAYM